MGHRWPQCPLSPRDNGGEVWPHRPSLGAHRAAGGRVHGRPVTPVARAGRLHCAAPARTPRGCQGPHGPGAHPAAGGGAPTRSPLYGDAGLTALTPLGQGHTAGHGRAGIWIRSSSWPCCTDAALVKPPQLTCFGLFPLERLQGIREREPRGRKAPLHAAPLGLGGRGVTGARTALIPADLQVVLPPAPRFSLTGRLSRLRREDRAMPQPESRLPRRAGQGPTHGGIFSSLPPWAGSLGGGGEGWRRQSGRLVAVVCNVGQAQDTGRRDAGPAGLQGPRNRSAGPPAPHNRKRGFPGCVGEKRNRREARSLSGAVTSVKAALVWSGVFPAS